MLQCPACKDYDIHRSRWSSVFERVLLSAIMHKPVRCYTCFRRFHAPLSAPVKPRGNRFVAEPTPEVKKATAA
jgi:hypothetical protein